MPSSVMTDKDAIRQKTLDASKRHKASWIELGQFLHSIYKEKFYRDWGFLSFETYCIKDLGMKQSTVLKLVKSYFFLEKEEPNLARIPQEEDENDVPLTIPSYESVNLLRLAKDNKNITPKDYAQIRESVIEEGREAKEVRAEVKKILALNEHKDPQIVRREQRNAAIKRLVSLLINTKKELQTERLLPAYLVKQIDDLAQKLQDQIEQ